MKLFRSLFLIAAVYSAPLQAVTVTTNIDEDDGGLVAASGAGNGISLREAINYTTSGDTITFDPALSGNTITLSGQLLIDHDLTIDASALTYGITIDANGAVTNQRALEITPGNTVVLDSLRLINGMALDSRTAGGGAIYNDHAELSLNNCTISGNSASSYGGGIYSNGESGDVSLSLTGCTISGNSGSRGGGIGSYSSTLGNAELSLTSCTVFGNSAGGGGGGVAIQNFSSNSLVSFTACTLSGNSAGYGGGGIYAISRHVGADLILENTILAGNIAPVDTDMLVSDFYTLSLLGKNLMSDSSGLTDDALIVVSDPMLSPLGDYGGPAQTMPPLLGSPAIDRATVDPLITSDQRGAVRSFDGDGIEGALPDIGAVELIPIVVTNSDDSGSGSLREAINQPFAYITFDPVLSGSTITLNGQLLIDRDLTIDASTLVDGLTIDGNGAVTNERVLEITPGNVVFLDSLTLINGVASGGFPFYYGGAIYNDHAELSLNNCTILGSSASYGGGLYSNGISGNVSLSLTGCTISGNSASSGGGIRSYASTLGNAELSLTSCTVFGNSARGDGGGVAIQNFSSNSFVSFTACTLSGNSAGYGGGGIYAIGRYRGADLILENTILAGNIAPVDTDMLVSSFYTLSLLGKNLISDSNGLTDDALIVVSDPMLSPLGDYGGPTLTMPPLPGSPAIEGGVLLSGTPDTDQRGAARISGAIIDIGAVEAFPVSAVSLADSDSDDIPDILEGPDGAYPQLTVGVDDSQLDSDGDGSLDRHEIANMTNPLDSNDRFGILSFEPTASFDPATNALFDLNVKTFPGLDYELQFSETPDFSGVIDRVSLGSANQFTKTLQVQLAPGSEFIRVVRK
ncbi:MAG: choice-of-anchor Q domain-containing protein [Opitutaceae bacterium]